MAFDIPNPQLPHPTHRVSIKRQTNKNASWGRIQPWDAEDTITVPGMNEWTHQLANQSSICLLPLYSTSISGRILTHSRCSRLMGCKASQLITCELLEWVWDELLSRSLPQAQHPWSAGGKLSITRAATEIKRQNKERTGGWEGERWHGGSEQHPHTPDPDESTNTELVNNYFSVPKFTL